MQGRVVTPSRVASAEEIEYNRQVEQQTQEQQRGLLELQQSLDEVNRQLTQLEQQKQAEIQSKISQGVYSSDVATAINKKYSALRQPLNSKAVGYYESLNLAKQGTYEPELLKTYAGQVESYQNQAKQQAQVNNAKNLSLARIKQKDIPNEIFINGQGYSVAPSLETEFIKKTIPKGSKFVISTPQGIEKSEFDRAMDTGAIGGYSGTGLTEYQTRVRDTNIKLGLWKEQSSAFGSRNVEPLSKEYFAPAENTVVVTRGKIPPKNIFFEGISPESYLKTVQPPVSKEKPLSFRDIQWKESFFPSDKNKLPFGLESPRTGDKTFQSYIEQKSTKFFGKVTDPAVEPISWVVSKATLGKIPKEKVSGFLTRPVDYKFTDIAKFAFFTPALMSGTAQQSQYADEVIEVNYQGQKVKVLKSQWESLQNARNFLKEAVGERQRITRANYMWNQAKTTEQQKAVLKLLENTYGKNFVSQNFQSKVFVVGDSPRTDLSKVLTQTGIKTVNLEQAGTVGGLTSFSGSKYAGQGQYEQSLFFTNTGQRGGLIENFKPITRTKTGLDVASVGALATAEDTTQRNRSILAPKTLQRTNQQQRPAQDTFSLTSSAQLFKSAQIPKQKTRSVQDYLLRFRTTKPRTELKPKPEPKPPRTGGGLFPPYETGTSYGKQKDTTGSLFKVFGRRRGKDILLGETPTQSEAKSTLLKFLKGTLGASGSILKEGKSVPFWELGLSGEYRPAKKDYSRVVQKRKFRLGTIFEKQEIQQAKTKNKKRTLKWF